MTSTLLERPVVTSGCPLPWCMSACGCDHNDGAENGYLHYGRPSSVETYDGDDLTVAPFQFNNSDETTGPRVEVGANADGRHQVSLQSDQGFDLAAAIHLAAAGQLTQDLEFRNDSDQVATVHAGNRLVQLGRFSHCLVRLSFIDPNDGGQPVTVEVLSTTAAQYARYVRAVAAEVTR